MSRARLTQILSMTYFDVTFECVPHNLWASLATVRVPTLFKLIDEHRACGRAWGES